MVCPFFTWGPAPLTIGVTTRPVSGFLPPARTAGSLASAAGVRTAAGVEDGAGWGAAEAASGEPAAGEPAAGEAACGEAEAAATGADPLDLSDLWDFTRMKTIASTRTIATPAAAPSLAC